MEDTVDHHGLGRDVKSDLRTPLKAQQSQAGSNVITKRPLFWKGREIQAASLQTRDIGDGAVRGASVHDVSIELEKVVPRLGREDDLSDHLIFNRSA